MIRNLLTLALLLTALPSQAAPEADPSTKLREQLRATLLQLRTAQTEAANQQAAKAAADARVEELNAEIAELKKRNERLAKDANDANATAENTIADLNNKLAEREKRIVQFTEALENWKNGYNKAAAVARTKEDERAKLATEAIELKRTIADREAKNIALFNTSNEILDRFENYALGKALGAREPFIGKTRVAVETLVQGYKGKILDNRISASNPKP